MWFIHEWLLGWFGSGDEPPSNLTVDYYTFQDTEDAFLKFSDDDGHFDFQDDGNFYEFYDRTY